MTFNLFSLPMDVRLAVLCADRHSRVVTATISRLKEIRWAFNSALREVEALERRILAELGVKEVCR